MKFYIKFVAELLLFTAFVVVLGALLFVVFPAIIPVPPDTNGVQQSDWP